MEDFVKGGFQYYFDLYKNGELILHSSLKQIAKYLDEKGFKVEFETIKQYAFLQKEFFFGHKIVKTNEKKYNIYTIDYKGETYTGNRKELADRLGISIDKVSTLHNKRIERLEREETYNYEERERLKNVVDMIKYQVSLPPCYKTFYHLSKDDDMIRKILGDEYKFTHIKNKKEGWNYWEITYADI